MAQSPLPSKHRISIDSWAVIIALLAAILVRVGVLSVVPW